MSRMPDPRKERQILRAAERLFAGRRFHEVTLEEVCRKAGVGKGTIYRYFANKDDLFLRVMMSGFEEMCAAIERIAQKKASFRRELQQVVEKIEQFSGSRRALFRMMQSEQTRMAAGRVRLHSRWREHKQRLVTLVADVLRRGVRQGEVRSDLPIEQMARALLGMLRGHGMQSGRARSVARVLELFLNGAAAQRGVAVEKDA